MNNIRLVGNLTEDVQAFEKVSRVRIAVNSRIGERDEVLFITCKVFGRDTDRVRNLAIAKGDLVEVDGRLVTESWEKDGQKRYENAVYVNNINKLHRYQKSESF